METLEYMLRQKQCLFDLKWEKQLLLYLLLAMCHCQLNQFKPALQFMNTCKGMVRELYSEKVHDPRKLDYIIASHTMTGFCLIRSGKLEEALRVLSQAERLIFLLVKYNLEDVKPPQVVKYIDRLYEINEMLQENRRSISHRDYDFTHTNIKTIFNRIS